MFEVSDVMVDKDEIAMLLHIGLTLSYLPECRPVMLSVANLYLRKQIIFERI